MTDAPSRMSRWLGAVISLIAVAITMMLSEMALSRWSPVADPYSDLKRIYQGRSYIPSQLPPKLKFITEAEEGLPGVRGRHLFTTNNWGFRGDDLVIPKPAGEIRVFLVGGSAAECFCLDDSQTISRILQDQLNHRRAGTTRVQAYNAGRSGSRSDDHVALIIHKLVHLEPDLIIVFPGFNDLLAAMSHYDYLHADDPQGSFLPLSLMMKMAATEFQTLRLVYYFVKSVLAVRTEKEFLEAIPLRSSYRDRVNIRLGAPLIDARPRTDLPSYGRNLITILGVAKAHDIKLLFVTQGTSWNSSLDPKASEWHWLRFRDGVTYREDFMDEALESYNRTMRQIGKDEGIPVYDLGRLLPKSSEVFYDDVHFTVKGAWEAGNRLATFIALNNLI